jgi:hypothetical protein
MFYPQSNFHSQGIGYPQGGIGYPGYPQGLGYPQGFGYPVGFGIPQGSIVQPGLSGTSNGIPFSNTFYGYPQLTPNLTPGLPQMSNWQHPTQQAQQQAALQQQAMLHLLATQLAQPLTQQHLQGTNAFAGSANGVTHSTNLWQQPQANPEQINPALLQQSQQQWLQRLAQYHLLVAQQLTQLAAQLATQGAGIPPTGQFVPNFTGQFVPNQFVPGSGQYIPSQLGANFVPGITMH